jgi:type III restriction enzyme
VIVEVKSTQFQATIQKEVADGRAVSPEGRKALAVRRWEGLNPDRLKYQIIFAAGATVGADQVREVLAQFEEPAP